MARTLLAALVALLFALAPAHAQSIRATTEDEVVLRAEPPSVPADWELVSSLYLHVYGDADTLPVLLELSRHGSASLPRLSKTLGLPIGGTVHVVIAPSQKSFFALQPGNAPEWADGTAYPGLGQIYLRRPGIRGPGRPLTTVFDHELVHVILGRAFAPAHPPRWLQEGVAQLYAGEIGPRTTQTLASAAAGTGLMSLEALTKGFPDDPIRAELAYAQSADLVAFLQAEYGEDSLRIIVAEMRGGADVRYAFRAATGLFLEDLDKQWRDRLEGSGSDLWFSALSSGDAWWFLAAVIAAVGLLVARFRIRRRMKRLASQEAMRDDLLRALWRGDDSPG